MKTHQSLRLSLREVFLLVALVGVSAGWYANHARQQRYLESIGFIPQMIDDYGGPAPGDEEGFQTTIIRGGKTWRVLLKPVDPDEPFDPANPGPFRK
jgi:hypothetical protein